MNFPEYVVNRQNPTDWAGVLHNRIMNALPENKSEIDFSGNAFERYNNALRSSFELLYPCISQAFGARTACGGREVVVYPAYIGFVERNASEQRVKDMLKLNPVSEQFFDQIFGQIRRWIQPYRTGEESTQEFCRAIKAIETNIQAATDAGLQKNRSLLLGMGSVARYSSYYTCVQLAAGETAWTDGEWPDDAPPVTQHGPEEDDVIESDVAGAALQGAACLAGTGIGAIPCAVAGAGVSSAVSVLVSNFNWFG